jgi:hypothetical protein
VDSMRNKKCKMCAGVFRCAKQKGGMQSRCEPEFFFRHVIQNLHNRLDPNHIKSNSNCHFFMFLCTNAKCERTDSATARCIRWLVFVGCIHSFSRPGRNFMGLYARGL